jgi:hypothetical protein
MGFITESHVKIERMGQVLRHRATDTALVPDVVRALINGK